MDIYIYTLIYFFNTNSIIHTIRSPLKDAFFFLIKIC